VTGFDKRLTVPLVLGSMLNPINSSMIAVALIPIGTALGAPPAETVWLISALYLATAVGQPVIGRLVDLFGPRRLYLTGTALVGVAGVLGAVAPSLGFLVVARVLLGIGTSAAYPAAMFLIRSEAKRTGHDSPGGILTALAVAAQVTAVIGPSLGGLLIGLGGWRTIFTVNIPLSIACLIMGARRLPRAAPTTTTAKGIDLPGMLLFAGTLVALMLFLMNPGLGHWYLLALALAAAAALAVRELRTVGPFIDLRLLGGNAPLLGTYLRQFLNYTASYAFLYGFTQWLEQGRGLSAFAAGLLLLPMFGTSIVAATISGRRPGIRGKLLLGSAIMIATYLVVQLVHGGSPIWLLVVVGVLIGVPQGLNGLANQNALYRQADAERMGSAAGLLRTFMYLGAISASAAVAACFPHGADTAGLHSLSFVMLACAAALLVAAALDRSLVSRPTDSREQNSPMALTTLDPRTPCRAAPRPLGPVARAPRAGTSSSTSSPATTRTSW
jgi:MFS family permease